MLVLSVGCEAPLNLDGVKQVSAMPVKRVDQFQSAASNGKAVVVVGQDGIVLVSTDQAKSWARQELSGAPSLIEVAACPDGTFAALDAVHKVWFSADSGKSWGAREIGAKDAVTTLTCSPDNQLWVGGAFTTIYGSADQGATWTTTTFDEDAMFNDIQFVDSQFAVAVGEFGIVASSNDAGKSWTLGPRLPNDFYPQAALFLDRDRGYAVGLGGNILKTANGGKSWEYEKAPSGAPLYGLTRRGDDLVMVGEGGEMLLLKGDRFERVQHGQHIGSYLRAALPIDEKQVLVAGGAGALHLVAVQN
jgi:photosystem II stability/assembly factor-like uncharacterized protein